jgi:hypothetical protein
MERFPQDQYEVPRSHFLRRYFLLSILYFKSHNDSSVISTILTLAGIHTVHSLGFIHLDCFPIAASGTAGRRWFA